MSQALMEHNSLKRKKPALPKRHKATVLKSDKEGDISGTDGPVRVKKSPLNILGTDGPTRVKKSPLNILSTDGPTRVEKSPPNNLGTDGPTYCKSHLRVLGTDSPNIDGRKKDPENN